MDTERTLGDLQARMEGLIDAFTDFRAETRRDRAEIKVFITQTLSHRLDEHSKRLGALERWRAWIAGGIAFLTAGGGLVAWLNGLFGGHR